MYGSCNAVKEKVRMSNLKANTVGKIFCFSTTQCKFKPNIRLYVSL